jgi:hypothetical protein
MSDPVVSSDFETTCNAGHKARSMESFEAPSRLEWIIFSRAVHAGVPYDTPNQFARPIIVLSICTAENDGFLRHRQKGKGIFSRGHEIV